MVDGKTIVSEEVFGDIARAAMLKVEEIIRQERKGSIADLGRLFTGRFSSKVTVKKSDSEDQANPGAVSFELKLTVVYGVNIPEVANKVREAVAEDVSAITGYDVERVDIGVEKLVRPEELPQEE
ncbi:MAG: Asp23/Gls24 family envelope stress response protein [Firmicutes bacterium]|nr:Asp23/Gls24 family envelope stress response protein [Bacillota bacterium]